MVNPASLSQHHAALKEARLAPAAAIDPSRISRRIDIAEGAEDGDARLYTYQHVVLDLDDEGGNRNDSLTADDALALGAAGPEKTSRNR